MPSNLHTRQKTAALQLPKYSGVFFNIFSRCVMEPNVVNKANHRSPIPITALINMEMKSAASLSASLFLLLTHHLIQVCLFFSPNSRANPGLENFNTSFAWLKQATFDPLFPTVCLNKQNSLTSVG